MRTRFYNNRKLITVIGFCFCTFITQHLRAQNVPIDTLIQTMQNIYKNYDSLKYFSFDIQFNYTSDTLLGKYDNEQMNGSYTLAGKKAKYNLGKIDFIQNDSFFIAVYNEDKMILVDEPKMTNSGTQLPLRQMMDSLVNSYVGHYNVTKSLVGTDTVQVDFERTDSLARFDHFNICYNNTNKMLLKVSYQFSEQFEADTTLPKGSAPVTRKKRLDIRFFNYRYDNSNELIYSENNYIYFEKGICKPVRRYENYKIYYSRPSRIHIQGNN